MGIKSLRYNNDIIIIPADRGKGSTNVKMNKSAYIQEGPRQLNDTNTCEDVQVDFNGEVIHGVNFYVHNVLERGQITEGTWQCLTTDTDSIILLYMLPKSKNDLITPQADLESQEVGHT